MTAPRAHLYCATVNIGERFQAETCCPAPDGLRLPALAPAPAEAPAVALPRPEGPGRGLWAVMNGRRSRRDYRGGALSEAELGALLWAAQGVTARRGGCALRAAPSAGALYPLDLYAALPGPEPAGGAYRYEPEAHALQPVLRGPALPALAEAALDQQFMSRAGAAFALCARPERSAGRYGTRAWRYLYLDAGGIGENLLLAAEALGLSACAIGAFCDSAVNRLLAADRRGETVVYLIVVGAPTPGRGDEP